MPALVFQSLFDCRDSHHLSYPLNGRSVAWDFSLDDAMEAEILILISSSMGYS